MRAERILDLLRRKRRQNDTVPVVLAPGEIISDPDRAEQLGLTVEARRMREGETFMTQEDVAATLARAGVSLEDVLSRAPSPHYKGDRPSS